MTAQIIIVGGGFGGLETAFSLAALLKSAATITLIDRHDHHSFIPSIHEIVSGKSTMQTIRFSLPTVLTPAGIRFLQDEVLAIEPSQHTVITRTQRLQYDYLVLSSGADNNFFGIPGAEKIAHRFRTPEDAEGIRTALTAILATREYPIHIILAGGGTEGVEVAGELIDYLDEGGYASDLVSGNIMIELIQAQDHLLPEFPPQVRKFAQEYLSHQGVTIVTGSRIVASREGMIVLERGDLLPQSLLIWTGGIKPSPLIQDLPLAKDPSGWLTVSDRLHSPDDDRVFAVGDIISIHGGGKAIPLPKLAYHAMDQAEVASLNIYYSLKGRKQIPYSPKHKPQLISMGKDMGMVTQGELFRSGRWVVDLKKAVERRHLLQYVSRPALSAALKWIPGAELRHVIKQRLPL